MRKLFNISIINVKTKVSSVHLILPCHIELILKLFEGNTSHPSSMLYGFSSIMPNSMLCSFQEEFQGTVVQTYNYASGKVWPRVITTEFSGITPKSR